MKYVKMLGLLAVAAAALMSFAGPASATLTSPPGTAYFGKVHATSEGHVSLTGSITITCEHSTVEGEITSNNATEASGPVTTLHFNNCGNSTVKVVKGGSLRAHKTGTNTATVYSTGAEVTVLAHIFLLGTVHCTYVTNETDIGTLTGSGHEKLTSTTATFDISASIKKDPNTSSGSCGEHATWEGSYEVRTPDHLAVS